MLIQLYFVTIFLLCNAQLVFSNSFQPTSQPTSEPSLQEIFDPSTQPTINPSSQPSLQPSIQPTWQPISQPSTNPSSLPSSQPSSNPSTFPSSKPTKQPSTKPSFQYTHAPSSEPSAWPSGEPSKQPSIQPSGLPTSQPTRSPSIQPLSNPSSRPTNNPSVNPSSQPSLKPSSVPTTQPQPIPSSQPTILPSNSPSVIPSTQPTRKPSTQPSLVPSRQPTNRPSDQPTSDPTDFATHHPTAQPTSRPSLQPNSIPTCFPTDQPTSFPSTQPSCCPSSTPSSHPTFSPSTIPSGQPTEKPTFQTTSQPSSKPSSQPYTQPTVQPSSLPTSLPSVSTSTQPSVIPSIMPSTQPSTCPSRQPTTSPSSQPFAKPSTQPSQCPSSHQPSDLPTIAPTVQPSDQPSSLPTFQSSSQPSSSPSGQPHSIPTSLPSSQPTCIPSLQPTSDPSRRPSDQPTMVPSSQPSTQPSTHPTNAPSVQPLGLPSSQPSINPSMQPLSKPTSAPSSQPTYLPTVQPSSFPSSQPSRQPIDLPTSIPSIQPTNQPTSHPTNQPSDCPSIQPSQGPSDQPSSMPTSEPSLQPFSRPSSQPSKCPTSQPSVTPTTQPSIIPTDQPSSIPSGVPTSLPSSQPSRYPTSTPTNQPNSHPTNQPSDCPTTQPSQGPSDQPSRIPTSEPSLQPFSRPSSQPSNQPSSAPSKAPSFQPSSIPSTQPVSRPSSQPSIVPSIQPLVRPTTQPSSCPSKCPTSQPTDCPTSQPSANPTTQPSFLPSDQPSSIPSGVPTSLPSSQPSRYPTSTPTNQPTDKPSTDPTSNPSSQPSFIPSSQPSVLPSMQPSKDPTSQPSALPTSQPSTQPTHIPTSQPTAVPSSQPTCNPSCQPSAKPSMQPTKNPSTQPTRHPSATPSNQPSEVPSIQPTINPTQQPTSTPTRQPVSAPTTQPSNMPSIQPSTSPSEQPTCLPTSQPTGVPSAQPSKFPSKQPTSTPTMHPSAQPTFIPSSQPSSCPSIQPTRQPTCKPTFFPTGQPTARPSGQPSRKPSSTPTRQPSSHPTRQPSMHPSVQPSGQPSIQPSAIPTQQPTAIPTNDPSSNPSAQPIEMPSTQPSSNPSFQPTVQPTTFPSTQPTVLPTFQTSSQPTSVPSVQPSTKPTQQPSCQSTSQPSSMPSIQPTSEPSCQPSSEPSTEPSIQPSSLPSSLPTDQPTMHPTGIPSNQPSQQPSALPSNQPTSLPSSQPSFQPTRKPSMQPTSAPSCQPTAHPSRQPSRQPTRVPSSQPSAHPTSIPSDQPSRIPSSQPTVYPSSQPSGSPSQQPTAQPTARPTSQPSNNPTRQPTSQPTSIPSKVPTTQPTSQPSMKPTLLPSTQPTTQPSVQPSSTPTGDPTRQPSSVPSNQPTTHPTSQPSRVPSEQPTRTPSFQPTAFPSSVPSSQPSSQPSRLPTSQPSRKPTSQPSSNPSCQPSRQPSATPSSQPSSQPSAQPSMQPSSRPSTQPSGKPSCIPTNQPTSCPSRQPSSQPTSIPSSQPTHRPTRQPSSQPSRKPSSQPSTQPTRAPSRQPSSKPTSQPSNRPTDQPTSQPSSKPTCQPSLQPFSRPSSQPSRQPSIKPSSQPSRVPSNQPTSQPSRQPTNQPTSKPSQPSSQPSRQPSRQPTSQPTRLPTGQPSCRPSTQPSGQPTRLPSSQPTGKPSRQPSNQPTMHPTTQPSVQPSSKPSMQPTARPSSQPSCQPTNQPSNQPSSQPTVQPTMQPSELPTSQPTTQPSAQPSGQPSSRPSMQPSSQPSRQPSNQPSIQPSCQPTIQPSGQPTVRPTTSEPSSKPTCGPSKYPTTSHPSMPGETFRPTRFPTSNPSFDLNAYNFLSSYKSYQSNKTYYEKLPNSLTFATYFYKGATIDGDCNSWKQFTYQQIALPNNIDVIFTSMVVQFQSVNFGSKSNNLLTAKCNNDVILPLIIYDLLTGTDFEYNCNDNSFRIFSCNGNRIFCVNCKKTCNPELSCPGLAPFIINSCSSSGSCTLQVSASAILNFQYRRVERYPLFLTSLSVKDVTNTSLDIVFNISSPGVVYCGVFNPLLTNLTSLADISIQGYSTIVTSQNAKTNQTLLINNLLPDTSYDVFCYTTDAMGHVMPFDMVVQTLLTASTSCCKSLEFSKISPTFDNVQQYFSFSLTAPPLLSYYQLIVNLTALRTPCLANKTSYLLSDAELTISPNSFTIETTNVKTLTYGFSLQVSGYLVSPTCFALSATPFQSRSQSGRRIIVKSLEYLPIHYNLSVYDATDTSIPPPVATTAILGMDGNSVTIKFDSATNTPISSKSTFPSALNLGVIFPCANLLSFSRANLTSCVWVSTDQLQIIPNLNGATSVKNSILIRSGLISSPCTISLAFCSKTRYAAVQKLSVTVLSSSALFAPIASLQSATTISYCSDVLLDPTASNGQGGKPWKSLTWNVVVYGLYQPTAVDLNATNYLNDNYPSTLYTAILPNYLLKYSQYIITLTVTNYLNRTSSHSVTISINNPTQSQIPTVTIYGADQSTFYRWKPLTLTALAQFPACLPNYNPLHNTTYIYSWGVFQDISLLTSSSYQSIGLNPQYFRLTPYSLQPSQTYTFRVVVSMANPTETHQLSAVASISLQVGRSDVIAKISNGTQLTTPQGTDLIVDAATSYDQDNPENSAQYLSYSWSCSTYAPVFGQPCSNLLLNAAANELATIFFSNPLNRSSLLITAGSLPSDASYNLTVAVVSSYTPNSIRIGYASLILSIVSSALPIVTASAYSSSDVLSANGNNGVKITRAKFNPSDKLILVGSILRETKYSSSSITASWNCVNIPTVNQLQGLATTNSFQADTSSSNTYLTYQLVISPNTLVAGLVYSFSLSATYTSISNSGSGVCQIDITMNSSPVNGLFTVTPSSGVALSQIFEFFTGQWTDDPTDFPLSYSFGYFTTVAAQAFTVKPFDLVAYAMSYVGQGLINSNFAVTCYCQVMDIFNASANITTVIQVTPPSSLGSTVSTLNQALRVAIVSGCPTSVNQIVSASLNSLNSVDCTVPLSCTKLNRYPCSNTPKTCGPCLEGYQGPLGDGNTPCLSFSSLATSYKKVGSSCSSNSSCITGLCVKSTCIDVHKTCPNQYCGGKGHCVYTTSYGDKVSNCSSLDLSCSASCVCVVGRYGQGCSYNMAQINQLQTARQSLCSALNTTLLNQDVSIDVITARAVMVANTFVDPTQLTLSATTTCTSFLLSTIQQYPLLSCYSSTSSLILLALSNILQSVSQLSPSLVLSINAGIESLSLGCNNFLAIQEAPLIVITPNIRMLSSVNSAAGITATFTPVLSPLSAFDIQSGQSIDTVQVETSASSLTTVSVNMFLYNNNPLQQRTNSSIAFLAVSSVDSQTTSSLASKSLNYPLNIDSTSRRLSTQPAAFSITLHNTEPIEYFNLLPTNVILQCLNYTATQPYHVNYTCPNGYMYSLSCPALKTGQFEVTCPGRKSQPVCTVYDDAMEMFLPDENCQVTAYNPYNTTCYCTTTTVAFNNAQEKYRKDDSIWIEDDRLNQRSLATTSSSGVTGYSTTLKYYTSSTKSTFTSYPAFTTVSKNTAIVISLLIIGSLFAIGLFGFTLWDVQEAQHDAIKKAKLVKVRTKQSFFNAIIPERILPGAWKKVFRQQLLQEHSALGLISIFHENKPRRAFHWIMMMSVLITFTFLSTILSYLFFTDDGTCGHIKSQTSCNHYYHLLPLIQPCHWRTDNYSCEFHVDITFDVVITFIAITTILGAFIRQMFEQGTKSLFALHDYYWNKGVSRKVFNSSSSWLHYQDLNANAPSHSSSTLNNTNVWANRSQIEEIGVKKSLSLSHFDPIDSSTIRSRSSPSRSVMKPLAEASYLDEGESKVSSNVMKAKKFPDSDLMKGELVEWSDFHDELKDSWDRNRKTRYYLATRLYKLQNEVDFILPSIEAERLIHRNERMLITLGRMEVSVDRMYWKMVRQSDLANHSRYTGCYHSREELAQRIQLKRRLSEKIRLKLDIIPSNELKDLWLIRFFLVDCFPYGVQRNLVNRYLIEEEYQVDRFQPSRTMFIIHCFLGCCLLPIAYAIMIYIIYELNVSIGSQAIQLWLIVAFVSYTIELVFLQPLKIWLQRVVFPSQVNYEMYQLCMAMKIRFHFITNRQLGVMTDAVASCVQHFNSACRTARLFPQLPMAKFLICLNDYDVPYFDRISPTSHRSSKIPLPNTLTSILLKLWTVSYQIISWIGLQMIIAPFTALPIVLQDTLIDAFGTLITLLLVIVFYYLFSVALIAGIVILILIFLLIIIRENNYYYQNPIVKSIQLHHIAKYLNRKKRAVHVFGLINDDTIDSKVNWKSKQKSPDRMYNSKSPSIDSIHYQNSVQSNRIKGRSGSLIMNSPSLSKKHSITIPVVPMNKNKLNSSSNESINDLKNRHDLYKSKRNSDGNFADSTSIGTKSVAASLRSKPSNRQAGKDSKGLLSQIEDEEGSIRNPSNYENVENSLDIKIQLSEKELESQSRESMKRHMDLEVNPFLPNESYKQKIPNRLGSIGSPNVTKGSRDRPLMNERHEELIIGGNSAAFDDQSQDNNQYLPQSPESRQFSNGKSKKKSKHRKHSNKHSHGEERDGMSRYETTTASYERNSSSRNPNGSASPSTADRSNLNLNTLSTSSPSHLRDVSVQSRFPDWH